LIFSGLQKEEPVHSHSATSGQHHDWLLADDWRVQSLCDCSTGSL